MTKKDIYYKEIELKFQSKDNKSILNTLNNIGRTGHAYILPLLFKLANDNPNQQIKNEIFQLLGQLKEKECIDYVVKEIKSRKSEKNRPQLLASCWQSGLDYSQHIRTFAEQFIVSDYVSAIEAFTVIEEWIHNSSPEDIINCKQYLVNSVSLVSEEKKALYLELVKLLESFI